MEGNFKGKLQNNFVHGSEYKHSEKGKNIYKMQYIF